MLAGTARRIERLLAARAEEDEHALARDEPLLAALAAASLRTRIADGPEQGEPWRRVGDRVEPSDPHGDPDASPHVPECRGMSLHAAVSVPAHDRRRSSSCVAMSHDRRWRTSASRSGRTAGSCSA